MYGHLDQSNVRSPQPCGSQGNKTEDGLAGDTAVLGTMTLNDDTINGGLQQDDEIDNKDNTHIKWMKKPGLTKATRQWWADTPRQKTCLIINFWRGQLAKLLFDGSRAEQIWRGRKMLWYWLLKITYCCICGTHKFTAQNLLLVSLSWRFTLLSSVVDVLEDTWRHHGFLQFKYILW